MMDRPSEEDMRTARIFETAASNTTNESSHKVIAYEIARAIATARMEEREACAKICETFMAGGFIARDIRNQTP